MRSTPIINQATVGYPIDPISLSFISVGGSSNDGTLQGHFCLSGTGRLFARKRLPENYRNLSISHRSLRQSINDAPYLAAVISAMAYASCPPAVDLALAPITLETNDVKMEKDTRMADLIFGSIAGVAGKIVEYPFDTIKVRLQTQPLNQSSGLVECIRQGLRDEGFRGLYKGLSAPLVGSMFENSVLFVAYNHIQSLIRKSSGTRPEDPLTMSQISTAGFLSGATVSFVLTPVELIKCRLQAQSVGGTAFKGPWSVIMHTLRKGGISGLYRGHVGTVLREAFGGAAWFGTYEFIVRKFIAQSPHIKSKEDLATWQLMTAGALSGVSYNAALFPADVIKSRQQSTEVKQSFRQVSRDLYRAEGMRGFYRGFGITIARSAPTSAVIFATYEFLNRNLTVEM